MPSQRPCAAFEPIPPGFDLRALVEQNDNFEWAVRIHADMIDVQGLAAFENLILKQVILGGRPLVIEGYQARLDKWTFAFQWLRDNCSAKVENARDLTKKVNVPLSIGHYLNHMAALANQWTDKNYKDPDRQRMYLKDIDCPQLWHDKLQDVVPQCLYYLNESTGDVGGLGAVDEPNPNGPGIRKGRGIAKAGDLMSSLPKEMRAENMMCYIGHEGTYTPAHREMCASLGQNIMVEASTGKVEDGELTKPGSSIWFMTETKEKDVVSEYWLSRLGHDIEVENHFAQINAWKAAPFKVYVVEQCVGDFILIPPLAPHQVWNRGTRTMKVAWNRTTVETLEMALHEALPRARMVCRDEQYKNKAIVYYTLQKYSKLLNQAMKALQTPNKKHRDSADLKVRQLHKDFRRLQALFTEILLSESFYPDQLEKKVEMVPFDSYVTCSYCRCNIFNRFLTCKSCVGDLGDGEEDTYDICMECYAMGRSCACISKLKWVEQFPWGELVEKHEQWRHQIIQYEGQITEKTPKSLRTESDRLGKKRTLAQICQTELAKRPFNDIHKPKAPVPGVEVEEEVKLDINGNAKKTRKVRRSEKFTREHARCHVDCHFEPRWKQAQCSKCEKNYCYGILYRGYDMMPQDIMADPGWQCPSCRNICNCRNCKYKPGFRPYTPSGTILGHNTKLVADPRSVESLVDFSFSNISWIQKAGDDHEDGTRRLKRRKVEAQRAQAEGLQLGDHYVGEPEDNDMEERLLALAQQEDIPIDPALAAMDSPRPLNSATQDTEDEYNDHPEGGGREHGFLHTGPPAPQFVVPDGGVIRDSEHAYTPTEAITYDYPDPEIGLLVPPPAEADVTEPLAPPGYEPAIPPDPAKIEMVERKRKRMPEVDEGDKPFGYKKSLAKKPTPRRSLIVKFSVDKIKLAEINKMAIIAQRALNGFTGEAPVLGSDLRALNATGNVIELEPSVKKARVEQIVVGNDDEFTPGRYRDRRKATVNGDTMPAPDSDITRRQTRMQAVTYADPSDEEEFDEMVPLRSRDHIGRKLATIEKVVYQVDSDTEPGVTEQVLPDALSDDTLDNEHLADSSAPDIPIRNVSAAKLAPLALNPNIPSKASVTNITTVKSNGSVHAESKSSPAMQAAAAAKVASRAIAQAEANRKAKLAAVSGFDEDSGDDEWSEEIEVIRQPAVQPSKPVPKSPASAITLAQRKEHEKRQGPGRPPIVRVGPPPKPAPIQKASAADWGDSGSSDDERPPAKKIMPMTAWRGGHNPHAVGLAPILAKRGRGRPRLNGN